jgi:SAM-dependent methyltransferase
MDLQLAIASSCTGTGCQVQFLDSDVRENARYSEPVTDYGIVVRPGDLVAVDRSSSPPQVVFRWKLAEVERCLEGGAILVDSRRGDSRRLSRAEGLESEIVEGDKVFVASGEVQDVCIDGLPGNPPRLSAASFPAIEAMYRRLGAWRESDPKQIVREGYDRIAERYSEWIETTRSEERARYTRVLLDELAPGAGVLDLGCGVGLPTTQRLAQRFRVTGADFSAQQIALARQNVPGAQFVQADITQLDLPAASFDAVAAFYTFIHVPREEQSKLLRDIASWLRPGGLLVATMSVESVKADYAEDFLGAPMYWSGFDGETNKRLVEEAGLRIVSAQEETAIEFDRPVTFLWVVARKAT